MKKKSLVAVILCIVMLFSTAAVYGADMETKLVSATDGRTIGTATIGFSRYGSLQGRLAIYAGSFSTNVEYIKATITVQKKSSTGSWQQYYAPYEVYGDAELGNMNHAELINVKSSGTYRVKVVFEDKVGSVTSTMSPEYSAAASL